MSTENKTAVQWLFDRYIEASGMLSIEDVEQAMTMEREGLINFHIGVMRQGLINEGGAKWKEGFEPKIRATAEQYYTETFLNDN
jgi:hypothetical protein